MSLVLQEIRHAIRILRRQPLFTLAALLCLALGIGANTAIFSILNGILLKPMPYSDPGRLVFAAKESSQGSTGWAPVSIPDIREWRERQSVLQGIAGFRNVTVTLLEGDIPKRLTGMGVTEGLFETLGVPAALGRTFTPEESGAGGPRVAILTWRLWQERFGGDPLILGRAINLQGEPHTVVGVMPQGFEFPWWSDIYVPLQADAARNDRNFRNLRAVARLGDGATLSGARAVLDGVQKALQDEYPDDYGEGGVYLRAYQDQERAQHREGLLLLMVGVGLVLLIACVNVANILLARAAGRGREMAIRTSLGARQTTLIRHLLAESLVLGGAGGALGLLLGVVGRDILLALAPMPKPFWMDFSLDGRVVMFVLGTSILTATLFGLAPALFSAKARPAELLRSGETRTGSGRFGWGLPLVAGEVALALALLLSTGAMLKGLHSLFQVDPGFDPEGVLTFAVSLSPGDHPEADQRRAFFSEAMEELAGLPGVRHVGAVQSMPLSGDIWGQGYVVEGQPIREDQPTPIGNIRIVHGEYLQAAGIPLVAGRTFSAQERLEGSREIVINASLARRYWPGENPIGKRLRLGGPDSRSPWRAVVGVVGDIRQTGLDGEEAQPGFYLPYANAPQYSMTILLRTDGDPTLLAKPVRRILGRLAPSAPVFSVRTLQEIYQGATAETRFYTYLIASFSMMALILTLLGVAGVMAFVVRSRVRETGIRVALGAGPGRAMAHLLLLGFRPVFVGTFAGILLGYGLIRSLAASFYGVEAWDPGMFTLLGGLLMVTSLVALSIPSLQALRLDPARVLKED